ncbi:MAG TPA: enoyl-CoA hydratase-related protein [Smithellaceae bacterium]|jgi:enoyl-CoA hydratase|nr:enoyl-CoA hydratase/isomerase family protein [Syntrophaceae bacterium]HOD31680.1 enoyl-CoA hydratase-related protein [Smithellaceae bacterium]MBP8609034.1 enoyl-CoA hydratase/isomerase family protein [Syntrophaceae bacterium]HOF77966.1 enoyl-CoA hydratase-related protein [Smithellaceae bacterium]HOM70249.1 enoyl-CoA hydratase-related protein [Smithellaceae bacterium]
MEYKNILLAIEEKIATLTFNRPKVLNAMNLEVLGEIYDAVSACANNDDVRAVIVTGAGDKAFVAGADIAQMQNATSVEILQLMEAGHKTMRLIETMPKPAIAAVNGFALGGGTEIALACDIRFASEKAVFGQPEILIGVIPGWGGTQRLPRLIGMGLAKEIILSGTQINAQRAYEIGLVNKVFPPEKLMEEARKFAAKLAALPSFALKMAKNAINYGFDMSLDNASALEIGAIAQCFATEDQKEGMSAFLEKRKPNFKGR